MPDADEQIVAQIADVCRWYAVGGPPTGRRWIGPFRDSFPDFTMEIVDLVADSEQVAAHFQLPPVRVRYGDGVEPDCVLAVPGDLGGHGGENGEIGGDFYRLLGQSHDRVLRYPGTRT